MNAKFKQNLIDKARLTYGLSFVLKDDIDTMRTYANNFDIENLYESVRDVTDTLDKLIDAVAQLEYILYLEKLK